MRAWEPEEDALILKLVGEVGTKWKTINKSLVNRTTASVRNRYARIKRGEKLIEEGAALKNRCHACGEIKRGHVQSFTAQGRCPYSCSSCSTVSLYCKNVCAAYACSAYLWMTYVWLWP